MAKKRGEADESTMQAAAIMAAAKCLCEVLCREGRTIQDAPTFEDFSLNYRLFLIKLSTE